jgi:hypothetical protein
MKGHKNVGMYCVVAFFERFKLDKLQYKLICRIQVQILYMG